MSASTRSFWLYSARIASAAKSSCTSGVSLSVPSGLMPCPAAPPNVEIETLGYCQMSLRDGGRYDCITSAPVNLRFILQGMWDKAGKTIKPPPKLDRRLWAIPLADRNVDACV
jgi:hypothetical protein